MAIAGTWGFTPPEGYHLLARLSEGGMGTVFLGFRQTTNPARIPIAFKLIHQHLCNDEKVRYMLEREHQLARAVSHANVLDVIDFGEHQGRLYLVMPYVEGATIAELAKIHQRRLPFAATVSFVADVLAGLEAIHSAVDLRGDPLGIVHRDVSPANILMSTDGRARMIDFGVATLSASERTQPGSLRGRVGYMAPEAIRGELLDSRGDLFAAGVVLYRSLTGVHPFRGSCEGDTLIRILSGDVVPPSAVGLRPPKEFDAVCLGALDVDPEQRFQTATEMATALAEAKTASGQQTSHRTVGTWLYESCGDKIKARRNLLSMNGVLLGEVTPSRSGQLAGPRTSAELVELSDGSFGPAPGGQLTHLPSGLGTLGPHPTPSDSLNHLGVSGQDLPIATESANGGSGGIRAGLLVALILLVGFAGVAVGALIVTSTDSGDNYAPGDPLSAPKPAPAVASTFR